MDHLPLGALTEAPYNCLFCHSLVISWKLIHQVEACSATVVAKSMPMVHTLCPLCHISYRHPMKSVPLYNQGQGRGTTYLSHLTVSRF